MPRLLALVFHHRFEAPPKVLALLNWICPFEPPGVLPDPPQAEPVEEICPRLLICKQFVDVLPRPDITRLVVEAPALKVWSWLQVLAVVVPKASEKAFVLPVYWIGYETVVVAVWSNPQSREDMHPVTPFEALVHPKLPFAPPT